MCFKLDVLTPAAAADVLHRDVLSFGTHKTVLIFWKNYCAKRKSLVQCCGNDRNIYHDNLMMLNVALQFLLICGENHSFIFLL